MEIRPHSNCKYAWLKVTSITAIPSKDCNKKVGVMGKQNLTLAETVQGSCLVMGSWDTAVKLGDGSFFVGPTNGWNFSRWIFSPKVVTFFETLAAVFEHFLH